MKKLITICLMMAVAVFANAQTKEETISWVKDKLEKFLEFRYEESYKYYLDNDKMIIGNFYSDTLPDPKIKSINIDECKILMEVLIPSSQWTTDQFSIITVILPTKIVLKKIKNGRIFQYDNLNTYYVFNQKENEFSSNQLNVKQQEENIAERIQKALVHLSTFCENKKETF